MKAQTFTVTIRAWPLMDATADDFARWLQIGRDEARLPFDVLKVEPLELSDPTADTPGKARRDASDTSRAAALAVMPRTGTQRARILAAFFDADHMKDGWTDDELAAALCLSPNSVRPRRVELVEGGWLIDSGYRRLTPSGNNAIVWQPSFAGWSRWHNERKDTA